MSEANNYRPIFVLATIVQVSERLVFEPLYSYFTENKFLYSHQFRFRTLLLATGTALLEMPYE